MKKIWFLLIWAFSVAHAGVTEEEIIEIMETAASEERCEVEIKKILKSKGDSFVFYFSSGDVVDDADNALSDDEDWSRCNYGTGTFAYHLAQVDGEGRLIEKDFDVDFGRILDLESVYITEDGILIFRSYRLGVDPITKADDALCCPRDIYLTAFRLSDRKIIKSMFAGRVQY